MPWLATRRGGGRPSAGGRARTIGPAGGSRSAYVPWCCSRLHGGKCGGQRALQVLERPVVADQDVRPPRLLVLRELTRGPRLYAFVITSTGAFGSHALVRHHGDRRVEHGLHPGLEQERHLDHRGTRARVRAVLLLAPGHHPLADPRPEQAL